MAEELTKQNKYLMLGDYLGWGNIPSEEDINKEKEYLESLAGQFSLKIEKNYSLTRSIVMDAHLHLESVLNIALALTFCNGAEQAGLKSNSVDLLDEIAEITFVKKVKLVSKLNVFEEDVIQIFFKVNDLRNAFAHGYNTSNAKYNYRGKTIFKREGVDELIKDHSEIAAIVFASVIAVIFAVLIKLFCAAADKVKLEDANNLKPA